MRNAKSVYKTRPHNGHAAILKHVGGGHSYSAHATAEERAIMHGHGDKHGHQYAGRSMRRPHR